MVLVGLVNGIPLRSSRSSTEDRDGDGGGGKDTRRTISELQPVLEISVREAGGNAALAVGGGREAGLGMDSEEGWEA